MVINERIVEEGMDLLFGEKFRLRKTLVIVNDAHTDAVISGLKARFEGWGEDANKIVKNGFKINEFVEKKLTQVTAPELCRAN